MIRLSGEVCNVHIYFFLICLETDIIHKRTQTRTYTQTRIALNECESVRVRERETESEEHTHRQNSGTTVTKHWEQSTKQQINYTKKIVWFCLLLLTEAGVCMCWLLLILLLMSCSACVCVDVSAHMTVSQYYIYNPFDTHKWTHTNASANRQNENTQIYQEIQLPLRRRMHKHIHKCAAGIVAVVIVIVGAAGRLSFVWHRKTLTHAYNKCYHVSMGLFVCVCTKHHIIKMKLIVDDWSFRCCCHRCLRWQLSKIVCDLMLALLRHLVKITWIQQTRTKRRDFEKNKNKNQWNRLFCEYI